MTSTTVSLRGVTKRYRSLAALDAVDLDLGSGITGLLGTNGAGKTTMLRVMATVLAPEEGRVRLLGRDPGDPQARTVASIATYRPEAGSFRVWLFTIAHRVVIDAWRKARPELSLEGIGEIPEIGVSPEHLAIARDRSRDLAALVALLPVDQANVVQLRLAGLTDSEIAVVLGRSHGAIRTAQHRAIKRLQELARAGDDAMRTRL